MNRRTYLLTAGATVSGLLAGCTEQASDGDSTDEITSDGDGADETTDDGASDDTDEPDETTTENRASTLAAQQDAIESYIEACNAEETAAVAAAMHSESPLNPSNLDIDFGFEPFDEIDPAEVEVTAVREGVSAADIRDLEKAELWFEDTDLDAAIDTGRTAFVTAETGHAEIDRKLDIWVLVAENEEWRVFFVSTDEIQELTLDDVRKPEITDDENDVVANVEWGVEPYADDFETDQPLVEVEFTDSPGIEAETVRVEAAVSGSNAELYNDSDGGLEVTWAGSRSAIEFDPEGDQIEVIAVSDGNETVVHREHYEP